MATREGPLEQVTKRRERLREMVEGRPYAQQVIQMEILYDMASMLSKMVPSLNRMAESLDEAAERLVRIQNALEAEHPKGFLDGPTNHLQITDAIHEYVTPHVWLSLYAYNYGPNTVFIQTNDRSLQFYEVQKNEDMNADFKTPTITRVFLKCAKGETAEVKLLGKW